MIIRLQLFLTACIVNFGFVPVEPRKYIPNQVISNEVNDDSSEVLDNYRNLFDSIGEKDTRKSEHYRDILNKEVSKKRQASNARKKELHLMLDRNSNKRGNFFRQNDNAGNMVAIKREVKDIACNPPSTERPTGKRPIPPDLSLSAEIPHTDKYFNALDVHLGPCFEFIKEAYIANNITKVKAICEEFHRLAGYGYVYVETVQLDKKWLAFQADPEYPPMQIDVITYEVEKTKRTGNQTIFHITSGINIDCVYYLVPTSFNNTLYHLTEDVCGVSKAVFQDPPY